jgi:DNA-binding transcriptional regulator YiaG
MATLRCIEHATRIMEGCGMANRNHTTARRSFGKEIRVARDAKEITRVALAKMLNVSESLVQAWETGRQPPKHEYLTKLITILEIGPDVLLKILEELMEGETSPEWTDRWKAVEKVAHMLLSYEHSFIPGLLQTEDYARALIQRGQPLADITDKLRDRLSRQEILRNEDAPTCVFIMDARVLSNRVESAQVMHDQILSLIEVSKLPNVMIQIFPEAAGFHSGQTGAFLIAKLEGAEVVYQDGTWRGHVLEDDHDVAEFDRIWMTIQTSALNKQESLEAIEKAVEKWSV